MQETRARRSGPGVVDAPFLGEEGAPVAIRYFADYNCSHCRTFETKGTMAILRDRYLDTGKARLLYVDFPVLGEDSRLAAQASRFVWRTAPEVFWAWHRGLFEAQGEWSGREGLVQHARAFPGIDADALDEALSSGRYAEEVDLEVEQARAAGAEGTPAVAVAGRIMLAVDPVAVQRAIEDALGGA